MPLVSVITPSFNQAEFIEETIFSVISQDYSQLEYIIVDGGSTDGSLKIIREYAAQYSSRIHWISEPDDGQADAINKGFRLAAGDVICWLNSDDAYLFCSTLSEVVNAFHRLPGADLIYGDTLLLSHQNRVLKVNSASRFDYNRLLRGCFLSQPSVFFRRRVIEQGQLDSSISIALDYEFWLRVGRSRKFEYIPRIWAIDRNHPARKILSRRKELREENAVIRARYGGEDNSGLRLGRIRDKFVYGLPSRLRGLASLVNLYFFANEESLAVDLWFDGLPTTAWRQLVGRNSRMI
jgi:glycosyltransferase involved in cell wall biosynthesis